MPTGNNRRFLDTRLVLGLTHRIATSHVDASSRTMNYFTSNILVLCRRGGVDIQDVSEVIVKALTVPEAAGERFIVDNV